MDPKIALIVALIFPLAYGIRDYFQRKKINYFSLFGLINVAITGGLALLQITGIWFSIKEAFFPALIGVFAWFSARSAKPLLLTMLFQPQVFKLEVLEQTLKEKDLFPSFWQLVRRGTSFLALSFFVSSALNFFLAQHIFQPISDPNPQVAAQMLNEQIAKMTSMSFAVIMVPSILMLLAIMWWIFRSLTQMTGLKLEELMQNN